MDKYSEKGGAGMKRGKKILSMALAALLLAAAPGASALAAPVSAVPAGQVSYLTGQPVAAGQQSQRPIAVMLNNIKSGCPQSGIAEASVAAGQQSQRPIAVMLNNIKSGCPQSGIAEASVVYEAPVEGRITRLMGLYENWPAIENIGYVRSSRDYFVYCALEHDAIYCHYGQATPYVGDLLNSPRVDNVSGAVAGINVPAQTSYSRTGRRKAPHNVLASGSRVDNVSGAVAGINVPAQTSYSRTGRRKAPHNVLASGSGILKDVQRLGYSQTYHGAVAGINVPAQTSYSRTGRRKAPHNVLASGSGILKDVQRLGYSQTYHQTFKPKFVFMQPNELGMYAAYPTVTQIYPGGTTANKRNGYSRVQARFVYENGKYYRYQYGKKQVDEKTGQQIAYDNVGTTANKRNGYSRVQARFVYENGKYYRYQYGKKQVDEKTGQQIAYDNVILQYCNGEVRDKNDYLAFGCHGDIGAPVQVFTQGKAINGTWTRHADGDPAVYVMKTANTIVISMARSRWMKRPASRSHTIM